MTMLYNETMPEQLETLEKSGKYISQNKVDGDNFKVVCKNVQYANGSTKTIQLINRHENNYTRQFPEIIAGLGVSLIIVSYAFLQHTKTVQREIFQQRANIQAEVIAKAEYTCSGRVQAFRQTTTEFQVICGGKQ